MKNKLSMPCGDEKKTFVLEQGEDIITRADKNESEPSLNEMSAMQDSVLSFQKSEDSVLKKQPNLVPD